MCAEQGETERCSSRNNQDSACRASEGSEWLQWGWSASFGLCRLSEDGWTSLMMDGVRPRGIIRMMVPFGSISFATLSANGRYLRTPDSWNRRWANGRLRQCPQMASRGTLKQAKLGLRTDPTNDNS